MSHHGNQPPHEIQQALRSAMGELMGEYKNGKLNADDAGALAFAVGIESGRVVIRFPKPVAWMGMTGDEALELAQLLIKHAKNAGITSNFIIRLGLGD